MEASNATERQNHHRSRVRLSNTVRNPIIHHTISFPLEKPADPDQTHPHRHRTASLHRRRIRINRLVTGRRNRTTLYPTRDALRDHGHHDTNPPTILQKLQHKLGQRQHEGRIRLRTRLHVQIQHCKWVQGIDEQGQTERSAGTYGGGL